MIDRKPALIARCRTANDVVAAVNLAREQHLPLSVYGGGHGVTGAAVCDAGITVDLRGMKQIEVDPDQRVARAGGGATWGEFDAATQEHGLAVTGGRVSTTGIAGLALGSGSGWLERKFGFVCDNLIAAEVVTADGRIVTASEDENAELFWGLRGGGGNFGIVTRFDLRVHPLGPIVLGGMLLHPASAAPDLLPFYRDFMRDAPDEVGSGLAFITAPPEEFVPEPVRGQPVIGIVCCYAGPIDEGEVALKAAARVRSSRHRPGRPDAVRRGAATARCRGPEGHAELLDRRLLRGLARRRRSTSSPSAAPSPSPR